MAIPPSRLSRREWLQFLGALSAVAALPGVPLACKSSTPADNGFFSANERRALGALANVVLPPDDTPGGEALGAVPFIERLLTAFDTSPPMIFAGGPYSGRNPFSDKNGKASTNFPPNDFLTFLRLDRISEASWRLKLFGSAGLEGGAPNEALIGPVVGLRDEIKTGLATAMMNAPAPLETLDPTALKGEFDSLDGTFRDLLIDLVSKAAFSDPEYGGNRDLAGWKLANSEGDTQPLGYSIYDENHAFELDARKFYIPKLLEFLGACGARHASIVPRDEISGSAHIMGTLRFGADAATRVCDANGRFHDVGNLYATDGALFPTSSGFNPTMTIVTLATRVAAAMVFPGSPEQGLT